MTDIFEKNISYEKKMPKQTEKSNLEKIKNMYIAKNFKKLPLIPSKMIKENIAWTKQEQGVLKKNIQEKKGHTYNNMNWLWKHYAKWKIPEIKSYILYDSTYMKCTE